MSRRSDRARPHSRSASESSIRPVSSSLACRCKQDSVGEAAYGVIRAGLRARVRVIRSGRRRTKDMAGDEYGQSIGRNQGAWEAAAVQQATIAREWSRPAKSRGQPIGPRCGLSVACPAMSADSQLDCRTGGGAVATHRPGARDQGEAVVIRRGYGEKLGTSIIASERRVS